MKKWCLFLSVYFCLCLLAACGAAKTEEPAAPLPEEELPAEAVIICRIVTCEDGQLLLAGTDGDTNIYTLDLEDGTDFSPGALVRVAYDGTVMESWPAQLSRVTAVETIAGGSDDLCALYLQVLEELWEVDAGLNGDPAYIGVDLSQTSLPESEQAAVAWTFAGKHGGEPVTGTYDQLVEQGYITGEPLEDTDAKFWHWADGVLFSITEKSVFGSYNLMTVSFDAQKWCSGLGAYYFCDSTSVQSADGHWNGYNVGSEAIS